MSFDISRSTFNPMNDYLGVVMEQGRVQVDADWNEFAAEFARRIQAGTLDLLGHAIYPPTTPNAFSITPTVSGSGVRSLNIGTGRLYVDGLLAENHGVPGSGSAVWDPALAELSGAPQIPNAPLQSVDYLTQQPYYPSPTSPPGNGPYLIYLDVWRRPVTYLQDASLVDSAIGVDTSGRLQTVWQVKWLDVSNVPGGVTPQTPDSEIPNWYSQTQQTAGQLTTGTTASTPAGPCSLAPAGGLYTGLENQLYRVEIHNPGSPASATFKWSRENGSVATTVTAIAQATNSLNKTAAALTVASLGRDQVLGFAAGNWIEITNDLLFLQGQPGEMHQIDSVVPATNTIILVDQLGNPANFPATQVSRIVRWDSPGIVAMPALTTPVTLENGITVSFSLNPQTGVFNTGDFWMFAARTGDGVVEPLNNAYPAGIAHHYARLAIVTYPSTAVDCRTLLQIGCQSCGCSVTVQPSGLTGLVTLQSTIDLFTNSAMPVQVCLMPGTYFLPAPLRFTSAQGNICLKPCQPGTVVIAAQTGQQSQFTDGLVVLDNVSGITLQGLTFAMAATPVVSASGVFAGVTIASLGAPVQTVLNGIVAAIGVRLVNCSGITIEDCTFSPPTFSTTAVASITPFLAGMFATGSQAGWTIRRNSFQGTGTGSGSGFQAGILMVPYAQSNSASIQPAAAPAGSAAAVSEAEAPAAERRVEAAEVPRLTVSQPVGTGARPIVNLPPIGTRPIGTPTPPIGIGIPPIKIPPPVVQPPTPQPSGVAQSGGSALPATLDSALIEQNVFTGLSLAVLALATGVSPGGGTVAGVQFTRNLLSGCFGGFWLLRPTQFGIIPYDPQFVALVGLMIALGYTLPQNDSTPQANFVTVPPSPPPVLAYTGTTAQYDSLGRQWLPDTSSSGVTQTGAASELHTVTAQITNALPGAADQFLYQSERAAPQITYTFTSLAPGYYTMVLKFAEIYDTAAGQRSINVSINNTQVLTNLDIFSIVGANSALDYVFTDIVPNSDGNILLQLTSSGQGTDPNAKISAVELDPQWDGLLPFNLLQNNTYTYANAGYYASFYYQLAQLSQQGYLNSAQTPLQLRISDNDIQGLSAPGVLLAGDDEVINSRIASLMMTGNRISASAPFGENFAGNTQGVTVAFWGAVAVTSITLAMLSSNTLINQNNNYEAVCVWLNDIMANGSNPGPQVATAVSPTQPPPQIIMTGNLLGGISVINPAPSSTALNAVFGNFLI